MRPFSVHNHSKRGLPRSFLRQKKDLQGDHAPSLTTSPLSIAVVDGETHTALEPHVWNQQKNVRLIDPDGGAIGVVPIQTAMEKAQQSNLDLVLMNKGAQPWVLKIMNHKQHVAQRKKKKKVIKANAKSMKEISISTSIASSDLAVKMRRIREFLEKKHSVKLNLKFRRGEPSDVDLAKAKLDHAMSYLDEHGRCVSELVVRGREISILIAPRRRAN